MMLINQMMLMSIFRNASLGTSISQLIKNAFCAPKIVNFVYLKAYVLSAKAHSTKLRHKTKESILAKNVNTDAYNAMEGQTLNAILVDFKNLTINVIV